MTTISLFTGLKGGQLTVKIKTHTFATKTKVANLLFPTSDANILKQTARFV